MDGIAAVLGPLLTQVPPKLGSKRPSDLLDQLKVACAANGLDVAKAADVTRLFTMSVGDLLREWFESDAVQALMAVNGVIGTWAGPRSRAPRIRVRSATSVRAPPRPVGLSAASAGG